MSKQAKLTALILKLEQNRILKRNFEMDARTCFNGQNWAMLKSLCDRLINVDYLISEYQDAIKTLKLELEDETKDIL